MRKNTVDPTTTTEYKETVSAITKIKFETALKTFYKRYSSSKADDLLSQLRQVAQEFGIKPQDMDSFESYAIEILSVKVGA